MKGIILQTLAESVRRVHGDETWERLLDAARSDGVYTSLGSYDDAEFLRLIGAAAALRTSTVDETVRWFGRSALPVLGQKYPKFFEGHNSTRAFLLTLNKVIHPEVRKIYPGADVPVFDFDTASPDTLVMGYRSSRKFCAFAEGLIQGAAQHFGERASIVQSQCMNRGDRRCVFRISFEKTVSEMAEAEDDRDPDSVSRLRKNLERERRIRIEAEAIAERTTRDLYSRQQELLLLERIAVAANQARSGPVVLQIALDEVCAHTGWPVGHVWLRAAEPSRDLVSTKIWHLDDPLHFAVFREVSEATSFAPGIGLPGRVLATGHSAWIVDVRRDANFPRARKASDIGVRAGFASPMLIGSEVVGVLEFFSGEERSPDPRLLEVMGQVGTQLGRVLEREAVSRQLVRAQEAEQRHIAGELHDQIGSTLTGLKFMLEAGGRDGGGLPPAVLHDARALVHQLMTGVHDLSLDLRPPVLDRFGLLPALVGLSQRFTDHTRIEVEFTHSGLDRRFSSEIEIAAFRIVQEALTNLARHAGVPSAVVRICAGDQRLSLQVEDKGKGFDVEQALKTRAVAGLARMKERATQLGGSFTIDAAPATGTRILAELPLAWRDENE